MSIRAASGIRDVRRGIRWGVAGLAAAACCSAALADIDAQLVFSRSLGDPINLVDRTRYAVADGGLVAFASADNPLSSTQSIRLWTAGQGTQTLATLNESITSLGVNAQGRVAYASARLNFGSVAESFVRTVDSGGSAQFESLPGPAGSFNNNFFVRGMNAAGQFGVTRANGNAFRYGPTTSDTPITAGTPNGVEPGQFNRIFSAAALDDGSALFQTARISQASTRVWRFDPATSQVAPIIDAFDVSQGISSIDGTFAASGSGNAAVIGEARNGGGETILLYQNGSRTLINPVLDGEALVNLGRVSVNDGGSVLFSAFLQNGQTVLATNTGGATTELIRSGDALFGSTVTALDLSVDALDDSGSFAFYFELANGRSGYAYTLVPAPGGVAVLLAACAFAARRRR